MNDKYDSLILKPGNLITTVTPFQEVQHVGPYAVGELVPWKGMLLVLVKILSNGQAFQLVLVPHSLSSGYIKKSKGKKGPKGKSYASARHG